MNRRELIQIEIKYLIGEHLIGLKDKESILDAYMRDLNNLEFKEMITYRDYLNFSIRNYYDSIEGYQKLIYRD